MKWAVLLLVCACIKPWDIGGPWACDENGTCQNGQTCDDGVCCVLGGEPACPTLPVDGQCAGAGSALYFPDLDGDLAGDPAGARFFCAKPFHTRWVTNSDDCDDSDPAVGPSATEQCNGRDDNCNGEIDEGTVRTTWFRDSDGDGFGAECVAGCTVQSCGQPPGYAPRAGDCAPTDPSIFPGAAERCDGVDENCNGQLDDPPFIDVENPGRDSGVFECDTGRPGQCRAGGLECLFSLDAGHFMPTCVARRAPEIDVCDGIDNDCNALIDDPPGCGGPTSFIRSPALTEGAFLVEPNGFATTGSKLPERCLRHLPFQQPMSWVNPAWIGTGSTRHVWFAEAANDAFWDLSKAGATLHIAFDSTYVGATLPGGAWGDGGYFPNPVITVCGSNDREYRRWVPSPNAGLLDMTNSMTADLPMRGNLAGWAVENGAFPLDPTHVTRVEVVLSPQQPASGVFTFTVWFAPDAGFH